MLNLSGRSPSPQKDSVSSKSEASWQPRREEEREKEKENLEEIKPQALNQSF